MANDEHVALLKQGVAAWNAWRRENPDARPNLSRADLSGANLIGAHLGKADLSKADLRGARLFELSGANLIGANLSGANLRSANVIGANLSEANLSRADLSDAHLGQALLVGANLYRANLHGAKLFDANLVQALLEEAFLHGANLSGANLSGASLFQAVLTMADLKGANLSGANLTLSVALRPLHLRHRAENIASALKRGVNVCQRQFVNEVLGPLVTEFIRNFGGEDATPIQHAFPTAAFSITSRLVKLVTHWGCLAQINQLPGRRAVISDEVFWTGGLSSINTGDLLPPAISHSCGIRSK
jgi:uncharacterized protein YjbI with pentapeptide repeats